MRKSFLLALLVILGGTAYCYSHCQIPCGIYDDNMRIEMIREHITTIEKSISEIKKLQEEKQINYNQLVRWIDNKEKHASEIIEICAEYFIAQRIKITDMKEKDEYEFYVEELKLLHKEIVYAMKAKQSVESDNVKILRMTLDEFEKAYFHKQEKH